MRARYHGEQPTVSQIVTSRRLIELAASTTKTTPTVGFIFDKLVADESNRVPTGPNTIAALLALGVSMAEPVAPEDGGDSEIPAAYTYFGQFIDHDITKTLFDRSVTPPGIEDVIRSPTLHPIAPSDVGSLVSNARSFRLDLDSVYAGLAKEATAADGTMRLSEVSPVDAEAGPISSADPMHDLPRRKLIPNPIGDREQEADRQALIGDPRNDENLLVAQLHVAFLRAHNALMRRNLSVQQAQSQLRRRYQWTVVHDFLMRVCDRSVVQDILNNGPKAWRVQNADELFMPLEFSGAAYRFGHSMIRGTYEHNDTFRTGKPNGPGLLKFMFTFTALSGDLQPGPGPNGQFPTLPRNWIIDWARFFDEKINPARRLDTRLTPELATLRDMQGTPDTSLMGKLAVRNLLRGYLLGLPTGQAVAAHLKLPSVKPQVLLDAVSPDQRHLVSSAGLIDRTPLWFYVLAEAGDPGGANGKHLGAVGSRIVAETLINVCRFSQDSVLESPPSQDELASGEFSLKGIVRLGLDAAFKL